MRLSADWEVADDFTREFYLEDSDGQVIQKFSDYPTLDELRREERVHGERLVLNNLGIPCANCDKEIRERFAADPRSNLICWDCALTENSEDNAGIRVNTDPSNATVSRSRLYKKSLCDYVVNVATGCRHGCKFCYVPTTPGYTNRSLLIEEQTDVNDLQREWGSYLLYRDDLPERLFDQLDSGEISFDKQSRRGRGVVMLSSGTDPYQDRRCGQISRAVIHDLLANDIPVRVLTRNPSVKKDADLFQRADNNIVVGSSIPSLNAPLVRAIEPGAPPPETRLNGLRRLSEQDVQVFVSMSPTYPTMDARNLDELFSRLKIIDPNVVFHEPINPRGSNLDMIVEALLDAGFIDEASKFKKIQDPENWIEYALKHINWIQKKAGDGNDTLIHSWPDRALVKATEGSLRDQLVAMRQSVSPEFGIDASNDYSVIQSPLFEDYSDVKELIEPSAINL